MLDEVLPLLRALLLLFAANGAPVLAKKLLGERFNRPLDGGLVLADGYPLLGSSKTIRGVAASIACTSLAAVVLGLDWAIGALFALLSLAGDLVSSFCKRRMGLPPQSRSVGLDQIPEALLPLVLLRDQLDLEWGEIGLVLAGFVVLEITLSPLLFRLRLRDRPY